MSVLASISTPNADCAPDCAPRRLVSGFPDVAVEVLRFERDGTTAVPYLLVRGAPIPAFESSLNDEPQFSDVTRLERTDDTALYKTVWGVDCPLIHCMAETNGSIVQANGTADRWQLDIWFDNRSDASTFHDCCLAREVPLTVERLTSANDYFSDANGSLSPQQRETLLLAYERGYFETPRRTSQEALAAELDRSSSAVSTRLRRGMETLLEETIRK